jgi:hypothetical protein
VAIKKAVEPYFKELAKERQRKAGKKYGRGKGKVTENFPVAIEESEDEEVEEQLEEDEDKGEVRNIIANFFDESGRQLEKEEQYTCNYLFKVRIQERKSGLGDHSIVCSYFNTSYSRSYSHTCIDIFISVIWNHINNKCV